MLIYTIFITSSCFDFQNSKSAFLFSSNILQNTSHSINSIFFYSSGVFNGIEMINTTINGISLVDHWYKLSKKFSINLYMCSTAAQERGITLQNLEKNCKYSNIDLNFGFQIVGLGQLVHAMLHSDRLLQF